MSGDEAAWRDLIARYELPAAADATATPWPERENLPLDPSEQATGARPGWDPGRGQDDKGSADTAELPATPASGTAAPGSAVPGSAVPGSAVPGSAAPGTPGSGTPGSGTPGSGTAGSDTGAKADDRRVPGAGSDRTRVVWHANPRSRPSDADADEDDDSRYIPPPPPPLPQLDSVGKGAWAALFCGPGYLLVATFLGWTVSGWAALAAVAAFIGGFAVVIVRMGDGPSRGDGPDHGAVV